MSDRVAKMDATGQAGVRHRLPSKAEVEAERDAWKGRFEGAAAIYADAAAERDALREELGDAKAGRKEWEHLWKQASVAVLDLQAENERLRGALERAGESMHDLGEYPDHTGQFVLRAGHGPEQTLCPNFYCVRARAALEPPVTEGEALAQQHAAALPERNE